MTARFHIKEFRFAVLFLGLFFTLQYTYDLARDGPLEHAVVDVATISPAAFLINLISPEERVSGVEHRLVSSHVRLSVLNGCEGTEALFLLLAAMMVFAAPWRHKLIGVVLGTLVIFILNQGRIVALYFALRHDKAFFEALHGYIGPTLIIILACLFFLWWAGWASKYRHESNATP